MSDLLMQAMNFDADELAENRAGRMSSFQRERLRTETLTLIMGMGIAALIFSGITLILIVSGNPDERCFIIPFAGAAALFILIMMGQIYNLRFEMKRVTVEAIEGRADTERRVRVTRTGRSRQEITEYSLIINPDAGERRTYNINVDTYNAIEKGARYRLYYAPKTLVPLSAEKLEAP